MGSSTAPDQTRTSSSSSSNSSTQTPYQQPYYQQQLGQADNLYRTGLPEYYGGPTVAGMTPAQMESMNLASNWVTGGAQDMMGNMSNNYNDMMSGRVNTGEGSPYGDMMNTYRSQAMDSANQMMQGVRSNQVMMGQPGGSSRGDLLNNQVIDEANKQVTNAGAQMYNNAYNQAQNTRNNALGQYSNIMNMPLGMSASLYNQVGLPQQQLNQNIMNDAKQRYDYNSQLPWQNLQRYQQMINGNMGSTSSSSSGGGSTQTVPGQTTSGWDTVQKIAGIGTQLMGIPGGGLISGLLGGMGGGNSGGGYAPVPSAPSQPYWT
jgi:hypothetical protein